VIISIWILAGAFSLIGIRHVRASTNIVDWYPIDSTIRSDYEKIRTALSGISPVNVFVESLGDRSVLEPDTLRAVDELSRLSASRHDVGKALSIADPLKALGKAMNAGDEDLPQSRTQAEQYLLLLEGEEAIWDLIARDGRSARIMLRVNDNGSESIVRLASDLENWWSAHGPSDFSARTTGVMFEFAKTNQDIVRTQLIGLMVALLGVGLVLRAQLNSWRLSLLALIPNILPIGIIYGLMGHVGIPLDAGTACLASLALGIAVDDTVHIAASWAKAETRCEDPIKRIEQTLGPVMPALALSSVCITLGFGVLATSDLGLVRNLGLVTSAVVALCWAADVTVLPILLSLGRVSHRRIT